MNNVQKQVVPDNECVICPECTHQFRAIPVQVQRLLRDVGIEPPFIESQAQVDAQPVAYEVDVAGYKPILVRFPEDADNQAIHFRARGHKVDVRALTYRDSHPAPEAAQALSDAEILDGARREGVEVSAGVIRLVRAILTRASAATASSELEMHRADYKAIRDAGFQDPGELLDAYKKLSAATGGNHG